MRVCGVVVVVHLVLWWVLVVCFCFHVLMLGMCGQFGFCAVSNLFCVVWGFCVVCGFGFGARSRLFV